MGEIRLSKSKVMLGIQCPKALYLAVHEPDLGCEISPGQQAIFDQGHLVGIEAQRQFPGGILIEAPHTNLGKAVDETQARIKEGARVIFEATFVHESVLVRVDILHRARTGAAWNLCEVKSSTQVKDQYIDDAAIQAWVLRGTGLDVKSVSIMHINNKCAYPKLDRLFTTVDVTKEVQAAAKGLPKTVSELKATLKEPSPPTRDIGPHCDDPYECEFKGHCWARKKIPEISIFNIPKLAEKRKWELYEAGIVDLKKLLAADEKLNPIQKRMVEVTLSGKRALDREEIAERIREWAYPLHFLDFETIGPAIPRFTATHPYEQVPFQFSCHTQAKPGGAVVHAEYLHDSTSDPRESLTRVLVDCIGPKGSVVAYNEGFESRCLSGLGDALPKFAKVLNGIAARLVDPWPILRAHVYDREFRGSFSIKSVAPALLGGDASYEGMTVDDGGTAQRAFEEMIAEKTTSARRSELRSALLDYCRKDTLAMVGLVEWMRNACIGE